MTPTCIHAWLDAATFTATHVVSCPVTRAAAVIDSVLDFDPKSGRSSTEAADTVLAYLRANDLQAQWPLETHAHADHFSAAPYLKQQLGGQIAIGSPIRDVQAVFKKIFNAKHINTDGTQFDHLFADAEVFWIGEIEARVLHTPGHTPACVSYLIGEDALVGDTRFMPDYGSAGCDFPGGDARIL